MTETRRDRRSLPRAYGRGAVTVQLQNELVKGGMLNVGAGGMALSAVTCPPPGSFLRIRFTLSEESGPLDSDAVLVRREKQGDKWLWGIRFESPQPHVTSQIFRYVHEHGTRSSAPIRPLETKRLKSRQSNEQLERLFQDALDDISR